MKKYIKVFPVIVVLFASLLLSACIEYFSVTLEPAEHIVIGSDVDLNRVAKGYALRLTVVVPEGKEVDEFTVDGEKKELEDLRYRLVVKKDHKVKVTFKDKEVGPDERFTVSLGGNLSSRDPLTNLLIGSRVLVVINIPRGKVIDKFMVDGVEVAVIGNTYAMVVSKNHTLSVSFKTAPEPEKYTVSLGANLSSTDPLTNVLAGARVTVTINVPEGKVIDKFKVDGVEVAVSGNTYVLTVSKNHTLSVSFKDVYTVSLGEGLSSTNPLTNLLAGARVTVTITVPEGKKVDKLMVDGVEVAVSGNTYVLTVSKNHTLSVSFKDVYTVSLGEGLSSTDPLTDLLIGAQVTVSINVPAGKKVDKFMVDGVEVATSGNTYVLTVSKNHTLSVSFKDVYTVSLGANLSSTDPLTNLLAGAQVTVTITVPEGKVIDKFKVDGVEVAVSGNTYVLTVSKNHTLSVSFKDIYTVSLGEGLSSTDPLTNLLAGAQVTVTINVPEGKKVDKLMVDGVEVAVSGNTYVLTVSKNHTLSVSFKDVYTVSLGEGLSSTDPLTDLLIGAQVTVSINVPAGKKVDKFMVDGQVVARPTGNTYVLTVSKNHTLSVSFKDESEPDNYVVYLGANLSSTDSLTNLASGDQVTIMVNIPEGQKIDKFMVDGQVVEKPKGNTYILTVSHDHVLAVSFEVVSENTAIVVFMDRGNVYEILYVAKGTKIWDWHHGDWFPEDPIAPEYHEFLGWFTVDDVKFDKWTVVNDSLTVYAKWKDNTPAFVTFMKNSEETWVTLEIPKGTAIKNNPSLTLPAAPTRDGYKFLGWLTINNEVFDINYVVTESMTINASWGDMSPVTISFMVEGVPYGTAITIPGYTSVNESGGVMPENPTKDGHYFRCWRTVDDVLFTKDTIVTQSLTLNAHWSGRGSVVLRFLIDNFLHYSINMQDNARITDYSNLYLPTAPDREFERFVGWLTDDGLPFDDYYVITNSMRIHAQYEPKEVVTVTFNTGITGFNIDNMTVAKNEALGSKKPRPLTKENHEFLGWFTAADEAVDENYIPTADITIFAKWTERETWPFNIVLGDGYETVVMYFPKNTKAYLNQLENYYDLNPKLYYSFSNYNILGYNLYNHWLEIDREFTATATWQDNTPDLVTITFNVGENYYTKIVLPRNTSVAQNWYNYWPYEPYVEHYTYRGWKTIGGDPFDHHTVITEDITVYADMEETEFAVTFIDRGNEYAVLYVAKGTRIWDWHHGDWFPEDPTGPEHHVFLGWFTEGGVQFDKWTVVNEAWVVYSKWQDNTP